MTLRAHRHFETTPPAIVRCWRCGRPTIYGLAEGVISRADITPLDPATEIRAIRAGRQTYTLRRTGLIHRDTGRRTDPNLAAPVLAEHCCASRRTA
jgi:hypothetical protein